MITDSPGRHICLADDDIDDHLLFSLALEEAGDSVTLTAFNNCFTLLEYLNSTPQLPEIIVLDVNMPGNEDHNCLIKIKAETRTSDIPVVIWSSTVSETVKNRAMECGADGYFVKPSSIDGLKTEIKQILKLGKSSSSKIFSE
jgi:CheY-like chemotaxis protein